ncbi:MAG TPA: hypothetical protein VJN63_07130 [Thermoplasmata archaeon]|nr:hypothetical protein [Thermoplasmata archaeon]
MNPDGHRDKAGRLEKSIAKLDAAADFEMIIEGCYQAAIHVIALACERRLSKHHDTHKGLLPFLDREGLQELAAAFRELESLRESKFYGGKGDGKSAKEARRVLGEIQEKLH